MYSFRSILLFPALLAAVFAVAACSPKKEEAPSPASGPSEQAPATLVSPPEPATPPASGPEEQAQEATSVVSGALRRSDVLLSPRLYRANWLEALESFHANRVVWTYAGARLISEAAPYGIAVQCTIPFWVPDGDPREDAMACLDPAGAPISISPELVFPDVNSDAWRTYVLGEVERLVDAGCTSFQQDVAWLNYQSAIARNGCYSSESLAKFGSYLAGGSPSADQPGESLDLNNGPTKGAFGEFQKDSTARYSEWLHGSIETYAKIKDPTADVTFSGNFALAWLADGKSDWLLPDFDFVLAEAGGTRESMPNPLREAARDMSAIAGISGVTIPSNDVWLNQRAIASAYALGLTAIVPWDVYVPRGQPRFFGEPADFSPLLRMVRTTPWLFDNYVSDQDFYGSYETVLPGQGTVTKVDRTTYPGRTTVFWSRREAPFQEVRAGLGVVVGGVKYTTIGPSHVGSIYLPTGAEVAVGDPLYFLAGADSYLISVRRDVRDPLKRAVHAVSWTERPPVALYLHLRRSEFPAPPTMLVTPSKPVPTSIAPSVAGDYYVYQVGSPLWAILY